MFRRIEFLPPYPKGSDAWYFSLEAGIKSLKFGALIVSEKLGRLGPAPRVRRNARFFFTERGWMNVGRFLLQEVLREGYRVRVIAVKERERDCIYQDALQVALRPKKTRNPIP